MEKDALLSGKHAKYNSKLSDTGHKTCKESGIDRSANEVKATEQTWKTWRKNQIIPSLLLCAGAFIWLMNMMSLGPSLLDMEIRTGSSIQQVSWIISAKAFGAIIGGLLLGRFIDRPSRWLQITLASSLTAAFYILIPWLTYIWATVAVSVLYGVAHSFTITAGQLTTYSLWENRKDSVSWQIVYQLSLSIGGTFGPLMVQPFLLPDYTYERNSSSQDNTIEPDIAEYEKSDTKVMYGFLIGGCVAIIISIAMLIVNILLNGIYVVKGTKTGKVHEETPKELNRLRNTFILCLCLYYVFQAVILRIFSSYIVVFCVDYLHWTKYEATSLNTAFFATGVIYRVIAVYLVRKIKIEVQLLAGVITSNVGYFVLLFFVNMYENIMWVSTLMMAIGISMTISCLLAFTDKHVGLKGFIGVIYAVAGSLGEVMFSAILGYLLENYTYMALVYMCVGSAMTCLVLMVMLHIIGYGLLRRKQGLDKAHGDRDTLVGK